MVVKPQLEVLLATWNGAFYLEQQLQSLEQQTLRPTRVLIHDDGSSDDTNSILKRWQQIHPTWIELLPPLQQRLGPSGAFNRLLLNSRAPYIALCDQDDIWDPERLEIGLRQLQRAESINNNNLKRPLLLHSNAHLINSQGQELPQSLWDWHRVNPNNHSLVRLSQRNYITGCTILCNRSLLKRALPIPSEAILHDWWLALVACQQDGLIHCPEKLLKHRRHGKNHSGISNLQRTNLLSIARHCLAIQRQWLCLHHRLRICWPKRITWWPQLLISGIELYTNPKAMPNEQKQKD